MTTIHFRNIESPFFTILNSKIHVICFNNDEILSLVTLLLCYFFQKYNRARDIDIMKGSKGPVTVFS